MKRRRLLTLTGSGVVVVLAGCTGGSDEDTDDGEINSGEHETDEPQPNEDDSDLEPETDDTEDDGPERSDTAELMSITDTLEGGEPLFDPGTETFSGSGQSVTDEFSLGGALTVVTFRHDGESNFAIQLEGPTDELITNEIGEVYGAAAAATEGGNYLFDITADGEWEIAAGQPLPPDEEIRTPPVEASGDGHDVVGPLELENAVTVAGEHDGESNFVVRIFDEDSTLGPELVFNEIGEFEGETRADTEGFVWIDIDADGAWSLKIE